MNFSAIISPEALAKMFEDGEDFMLFDVSNHAMARKNYDSLHLKGAYFVDVNTQLSDIKDNLAVGGRHPLPTSFSFGKTLESLGIAPDTHVIIYDDSNGANAGARFWWMLKAQGHQKVQILDGGMKSHVLDEWKIDTASPDPQPTTYPVSDWQFAIVEMDVIEQMRSDDDSIVVDVRDAPRYRGEVEPIDLIAGHIPGAINIPYIENLATDGLFKSPESLKELYEGIFENIPADKIAIHCGSGVTACATLLAIYHAGLEVPNLYVGSWSEWSRNDRELATINK